MSLIDMLKAQSEFKPDRVALIAGNDLWTYRRLAEATEHFARVLSARGIERGDRIVLHMTNVPELVIAFYACFRIGAIAAPLHVRLTTAELRSLMQRLRPTLYLGEAEFYPAAARLEADILAFDARFVLGDVFEDGCVQRWADLVGSAEQPIVSTTDIKVPSVLMMTSGTTGFPKFVMHTQATLSAATDASSRLGFDGKQIALMTTTMAHASGLFVLVSSVRYGMPIVLLRGFDPDAAVDAIELHRCSLMLNLPFMAIELIRSQQTRPRNIGSLRMCLVGGDVCPVAVQHEFAKVFDTPLRSLWASTESGPALNYGLDPGPVSRVAPGTKVSLVDDAGSPVPRGQVGELLLQSPGLAVGYWSGPGQFEALLENGWFHTGDQMQQGDGDELWYVSRKKEMLVRGGDNISPVEVEQVLLTHPAVRDAAVTGVPDAELGQRVAALVQLEDGVADTVLDDIRGLAAEQLASYKVPEILYSVSGIPKNALGKTDRRALGSILLDTEIASLGAKTKEPSTIRIST